MAHSLVTQRLAACVNLLPGVTSVYHWNDVVECAEEVTLLIKTTAAALPALGVTGIWMAIPIGWFFADLVGILLWRREDRQSR